VSCYGSLKLAVIGTPDLHSLVSRGASQPLPIWTELHTGHSLSVPHQSELQAVVRPLSWSTLSRIYHYKHPLMAVKWVLNRIHQTLFYSRCCTRTFTEVVELPAIALPSDFGFTLVEDAAPSPTAAINPGAFHSTAKKYQQAKSRGEEHALVKYR